MIVALLVPIAVAETPLITGPATGPTTSIQAQNQIAGVADRNLTGIAGGLRSFANQFHDRSFEAEEAIEQNIIIVILIGKQSDLLIAMVWIKSCDLETDAAPVAGQRANQHVLRVIGIGPDLAGADGNADQARMSSLIVVDQQSAGELLGVAAAAPRSGSRVAPPRSR